MIVVLADVLDQLLAENNQSFEDFMERSDLSKLVTSPFILDSVDILVMNQNGFCDEFLREFKYEFLCKKKLQPSCS